MNDQQAQSLNTYYFQESPLQPTLRYQIGQMLLLGFDGISIDQHAPIAQAISEDGIGGVILFDYDYTNQRFGKNIQDPSQVTQLNQTLQTLNTNARHLDQH